MGHSLKAKNKHPVFDELHDLVRADVERIENDPDNSFFLQSRGNIAKVPKWIVLDGVDMELPPDFEESGATRGNYRPTNKEKVPKLFDRARVG